MLYGHNNIVTMLTVECKAGCSGCTRIHDHNIFYTMRLVIRALGQHWPPVTGVVVSTRNYSYGRLKCVIFGL